MSVAAPPTRSLLSEHRCQVTDGLPIEWLQKPLEERVSLRPGLPGFVVDRDAPAEALPRSQRELVQRLSAIWRFGPRGGAGIFARARRAIRTASLRTGDKSSLV